MSRSRRLSPRQGEILRILREAHEEDIGTLMRELTYTGPNDLYAIREAIEGLVRLRLIEVGDYEGIPRTLHSNDELIARIFTEDGPLEWDQEGGSWIFHPQIIGLVSAPYVVLTELGNKALTE